MRIIKEQKLRERLYDLVPEHDNRGSFYGKAKVEVRGNDITLYSYNTPIVKYNLSDRKVVCLCDENDLSATTMRHLREFIQQAVEDDAIDAVKQINKAWVMSLPKGDIDESLEDDDDFNEFVKNHPDMNKDFDRKRFGKYFDKNGEILADKKNDFFADVMGGKRMTEAKKQGERPYMPVEEFNLLYRYFQALISKLDNKEYAAHFRRPDQMREYAKGFCDNFHTLLRKIKHEDDLGKTGSLLSKFDYKAFNSPKKLSDMLAKVRDKGENRLSKALNHNSELASIVHKLGNNYAGAVLTCMDELQSKKAVKAALQNESLEEDLDNVEVTDNTVEIPQPMAVAKEESEDLWKRFIDATEEPKDAPLFGAEDQPVPEKVEEPKAELEESLSSKLTLDEGLFENKKTLKEGIKEEKAALREVQKQLRRLLIEIKDSQKSISSYAKGNGNYTDLIDDLYEARNGLLGAIDDIDNLIFEDHQLSSRRNESLKLKEGYSVVDLETGDRFGNYDDVEMAKSKAYRYATMCYAKCAVIDDKARVICGFSANGKEIKARGWGDLAVSESLKKNKKSVKENFYLKTKNTKKKLNEAYITKDFDEFEPWSGAVEVWEKILDEDKLDDLERFVDEVYSGVIGETELNDLLRFDSDYVYDVLGMSAEEDVDESLNERNLTRAERHNKEMNKIFSYKKATDDAMKDFLVKNGVSEDEAEELYQQDKLGLKLRDLGLNDEFFDMWQSKKGDYDKSGQFFLKEKMTSPVKYKVWNVDWLTRGYSDEEYDFIETLPTEFEIVVDEDLVENGSIDYYNNDIYWVLYYALQNKYGRRPTDFEFERIGEVNLKESKSLKGKKRNLEEASTLPKGGKDEDFDTDAWSVIYWELSADSEDSTSTRNMKKLAKTSAKASDKYERVDPVNDTDLRVYAKDENGFKLAKKVADAWKVKYEIEPTKKSHQAKFPDDKLQMTIFIPEEMLG